MNSDIPRRSQPLPTIRGAFKVSPEDFEVEEVPAYEPSGEGPHIYLWIQERDASASWALRQIAKFFDVDKRDIGRAGLKDRQAVTRQYYSVPRQDVDAALLETLPGAINDQIEVLAVSAHQNKLRRGHLLGNDFSLRIRLAEDEDLDSAHDRASALLDVLARRGVPNAYGSQRFGREGETSRLGYALLAQDDEARRKVRRDRFLKRLALNAAQSDMFNEALARRASEGLLDTVLEGDVLMRRETGGVFVSEDAREDQVRMDAGELVLTGPMFGPDMRAPSGEMARMEREILNDRGLDMRSFGAYSKVCSGARRPMLVWPERVTLEAERDAHALRVGFFLPSGSYATVVLSEMLTPSRDEEI